MGTSFLENESARLASNDDNTKATEDGKHDVVASPDADEHLDQTKVPAETGVASNSD